MTLGWVRDTVFRLLPHRAPTGLMRIGDPGRDSPVLLTGSFTLTVRRVRRSLRGIDAWLLVANSNGINVWCAAGGGHLTHHDVISVLRTSAVEEQVDHRKLYLPQLAATGVERRAVEAVTGWKAVWGPANIDDLPDVLARGGTVRGGQRRVRFPLRERLEMASIWFVPTALVLSLVIGLLVGAGAAAAIALAVILSVGGLFAALPLLPVIGPRRWLAYGGFAVAGALAGAGLLLLLGRSGWQTHGAVTAAALVAMAVLSIDLAGTTPLFPSSVNSRGGTPAITLDTGRCTGAADCMTVCPRGVLTVKGSPAAASIAAPASCIACGACVVQCPDDALYFTMPDGSIVEPSTVRSTRLNLLGERSVEV